LQTAQQQQPYSSMTIAGALEANPPTQHLPEGWPCQVGTGMWHRGSP
jgi:hypothetical protein